MLSRASRILTYALALLYAITGAGLFLLPDALAPVFAWKVTPFITMTIGGWCLGNAWLAWISARRWQWALIYTALIYLWIFGLLEATVLFAFRANLRLIHPIAWSYLTTLALNVVAALVGLFDWFRIRPNVEDLGAPVGRWSRIAALAFVVFVGFLGVYGMLVQSGAPGTNGGIFPEVVSLFTLRSFGAFYLSLALAALPLLAQTRLGTALHHGYAAFGLIVFITIAAFVYIGLFDFVHRPGGLAYFAAYLVVGIPLLFVFRRLGTGAPLKQTG
jgi:hypothetical protein